MSQHTGQSVPPWRYPGAPSIRGEWHHLDQAWINDFVRGSHEIADAVSQDMALSWLDELLCIGRWREALHNKAPYSECLAHWTAACECVIERRALAQRRAKP